MNFDAWVIQTIPFAVLSAHFVVKIFHLFLHFHTGSHFLLPQRANYWGTHPNPELDETDEF